MENILINALIDGMKFCPCQLCIIAHKGNMVICNHSSALFEPFAYYKPICTISEWESVIDKDMDAIQPLFPSIYKAVLMNRPEPDSDEWNIIKALLTVLLPKTT